MSFRVAQGTGKALGTGVAGHAISKTWIVSRSLWCNVHGDGPLATGHLILDDTQSIMQQDSTCTLFGITSPSLTDSLISSTASPGECGTASGDRLSCGDTRGGSFHVAAKPIHPQAGRKGMASRLGKR